jgi:heptose I phosphotransferase
VLEELQQLGILAPRVVAYGQEGSTPAAERSFLVTEEIAETISLETLGRRSDPWSADPTLKRRLIRAVAQIARELHTHGINHRDFYLCHFLLGLPVEDPSVERKPRLYLIDLHRAQKRDRVPRRWLVKDLGGLLFSAMDVELGPRDLALFVRCYSGRPYRTEMRENSSLWRSVVATADRLYRKIHRKRSNLDLAAVFDQRSTRERRTRARSARETVGANDEALITKE